MAVSSAGRAPGGNGNAVLGLSLCAGAGGLDLGLRLAVPGYRPVCHVERDAFAAAVLVARMEDQVLDPAPVWDDVATFDGRGWRGVVDCLSAGFPCQPYSIAGRRGGASDPRHLWPHIARIIGECKPPFLVFENVPHLLRLGFAGIAEDLVGLGYRVAAGLFTAAEVGAPHQRERLFVLAHRAGADPLADPRRLLVPLADAPRRRGCQVVCRQAPSTQPAMALAPVGDADGAGSSLDSCRAGDPGTQQQAAVRAGWEFPFPPGPGDEDGWRRFLAQHPDAQPSIRRTADGLAWRVDRLRLCGNGVVPLVAAHALRTLAAELTGDGG
ncbi:MAG: DNA cytosine methyltransferase [Alphaproteobacteria bacterium]